MALAIIYFTVGFTFFLAELSFYGPTLFMVLPILVGLAAGFLPNRKYGFAGAVIGLLAFFVILILGHFEGLACLVYTFPVMILALVAGMVISNAVKARAAKKSGTFKFIILPVFLFGGSTIIENIMGNSKAEETVSTSIYLPHAPDSVWNYIKSVDTLDTNKPFWLKVGLPVPQKCIMEGNSVGAKRICYFEGGTIDEVVTEMKKPQILKMKVTRYNLPGLRWLSFKDAIYSFDRKGSGTVLTRTTTYFSELKPRFYWRLCEKSAIGSEHEYVLNDLQRRLQRK